MKTKLYLHNDSIRYNETDSEYQVSNKLVQMAKDLMDARYYKFDFSVCVSSDLLTTQVFTNTAFIDELQKLDYEEKNFLFSVIYNTSDECNLSYEKLESICVYDKEEIECNAMLVLNHKDIPNCKTPYISFEKYEVVYNKDSIVKLRRQILGNHPASHQDFLKECRMCFNSICFHDSCLENSDSYLNWIPRKIVYCLSCLNDCFNSYRSTCGLTDANSILSGFVGLYGIEEASLQRNSVKNRKSQRDLTFTFNKNKEKIGVYCESHLKINSYDKNYSRKKGDPNQIHARLYFHFGLDNVENDKILMGSIGPHF